MARKKGDTEQTTKVMVSKEQMIQAIVNFFNNSKAEVMACLDNYTLILTTDMQVIQEPKAEARKRGVRLKYITDITRENLPYIKRQLDMVDEMRHLEGVHGNFILSDSEFMASADITPERPMVEGVYSNINEVIKQERYIFEVLWKYAVPALERISELEGLTRTSEISKRVIDRFYICSDCKSAFIYIEDAQEHKQATGHGEMHEFPISDWH